METKLKVGMRVVTPCCGETATIVEIKDGVATVDFDSDYDEQGQPVDSSERNGCYDTYSTDQLTIIN